MDDVARRAQVGVGTVYRHFPTKEALLEALALEAFERITEFAKAAVRRPGPVGGLPAHAVDGRRDPGGRPRAV